MTIDSRLYKVSVEKIVPTIETLLKKGQPLDYICCNISASTGIPVIVLYTWCYENKGELFEHIKRLARFFQITEVIGSNGQNILDEKK